MDQFQNRKFRKYLIYFLIIFCILISWKLLTTGKITQYSNDIEEDCLNICLQSKLLKKFECNSLDDIPTIYAITPTYYRYVQKAELTRISQTLMLVPNIHWIVIEDSDEKTDLVTNLIRDSGLKVTHLNARTPRSHRYKKNEPRHKHHRGVEQRNKALSWLRNNLQVGKDKGFVYFMDDDNTYSYKIFSEIMKINKVGVWPVGLIAEISVETPILDPKTGKVKYYKTGYKPKRQFAIDMAGFAINLDLLLFNTEAKFSYYMKNGSQEIQILRYFVTKEDLEPLADNCTKVYVWHTRTVKPKIKYEVSGFEV